MEGEALLTRLPIVETGNLDYRARGMVALVALFSGQPIDVYVTHQYMSRGDDSLRLFQAQRLLAWIDSRRDVDARIVCGDFNATLDQPSAALLAARFRSVQTAPTAFTALADENGSVSHSCWPRMDRCIDYIWIEGPLEIVAGGICFDRPDARDPSLWPSDHAGVRADLCLA